MQLFNRLKQLEEFGVDCSSDLEDLLIKGILPDGSLVSEVTRKEFICLICDLIYDTRNDLEHIKRIIND